jgi:hypothetical protein
MSTIQHKKGRPSRAERIKIRKELQPYFEKRRTHAYKAAQLTGYDTKTVNKYYEQFYMEIHGYEAKNFVQRYEKERMQCAMLFENLIFESNEMLENIKDQIQKLKKKGEDIPPHLIQNYSRIIRDIAHLAEKKTSLLMQPDAGDMLDEIIEKRIDKHV